MPFHIYPRKKCNFVIIQTLLNGIDSASYDGMCSVQQTSSNAPIAFD
uniref:Uncharacterized protein n=1 Tax=Enterococcus faecium TaxID=1352 RepID=Q9X557_ENTFC|nr:unknown [Enterococcus faecium]